MRAYFHKVPVIQDARSFGAAIRAVRRARGLSQEALATQARVSRRTLAAIEAGHTNGEVGMFLAILRALDMGVFLQPVPPADFSLDTLNQHMSEP